MTAQEKELAELIVAALNLEIQADDIEPGAPLYRDGLGLDSIDILEIALAVSKRYAFKCAPMIPAMWRASPRFVP